MFIVKYPWLSRNVADVSLRSFVTPGWCRLRIFSMATVTRRRQRIFVIGPWSILYRHTYELIHERTFGRTDKEISTGLKNDMIHTHNYLGLYIVCTRDTYVQQQEFPKVHNAN